MPCPGIWDGRSSVVNWMKVAFDVGSARSMIFDSGTPIQGITIDQASTQRRR